LCVKLEVEIPDKLDTNWPDLITPRLLESNDLEIQNLFRKELKRHQPQLFQWNWIQGTELPINTGQQDEYWDKAYWWINKKYPLGFGRIFESCESSTAITYARLGDGYKLHFAGYNPKTRTRVNKKVLLLDWLYLSSEYEGKSSQSGTRKLREFLKHLEKMPSCPYHTAILYPVGEEMLSKYSPHLKATDYQASNHTTEELVKIYKYWLKIKELPVFAYTNEPYYMAECFKPIDPLYQAEECSWLS
jgi:hypothetical protein